MTECVRAPITRALTRICSPAAERKLRDAQVRATINQKLIESGEKERRAARRRARLAV
jgi:hypothetical protein